MAVEKELAEVKKQQLALKQERGPHATHRRPGAPLPPQG